MLVQRTWVSYISSSIELIWFKFRFAYFLSIHREFSRSTIDGNFDAWGYANTTIVGTLRQLVDFNQSW